MMNTLKKGMTDISTTEAVNLHLSLEEMNEVLDLLRENERNFPETILDRIYEQLNEQDYFQLSKQAMPQSYSSYTTLKMIEDRFEIEVTWKNLFQEVSPVSASTHLEEDLSEDSQLAITSEKSRSEGIIVPMLKEIKRINERDFTIFSGETFQVDDQLGLTGECDFLFSYVPETEIIKAPVFALVEAKKKDLQEGWGQCAAQMVAAQRFNQEEKQGKKEIATVYGCVTTGELWQFAELRENHLTIDKQKRFIESKDAILGILQYIINSVDVNSSKL